MFEPVRIRIAAHHDTYSRTATVASYEDPECSPGMFLIPAVRVRFSSLTNQTLIRILGEWKVLLVI